MASSTWSSLHADILLSIYKLFNTDVDILRLRSVCSYWRSIIPPRLRPSPFPLKLPPLLALDNHALINYTTVYRLSPIEIGPCAGDPSDGWLFRVSEESPNRFTLLSPMFPIWVKYAPGSIPDSLNLLHYRITEICRCYFLYYVDFEGSVSDWMEPKVEKVSVVSNENDFAVYVLFINGKVRCWKYEQEDWSSIDTMGQRIDDIVVSNGKCYGISNQGMLFYFDSNLKVIEIPVARLPSCSLGTVYYLVEYRSDWYVVLKTVPESMMDYAGDTGLIGTPPSIPFKSALFKKCGDNWEKISCMPEVEIVCCEDASIVLPVKDFESSKGNCVHLGMNSFLPFNSSRDRAYYHGVYDFDEDEYEYESMNQVEGSRFLSWPPPSWLLSG